MRSSPLRLRWPLLVLMGSIGLTAFAAFDTQRTVRGQTKLVNKALHEFATFLPYDATCDCHRTTAGPNPATFFAFKLGTKNVDVAKNSYANPEEGWRIDPMPDRMMADMSSDMMSGASVYTDAERKWIADTLTVQSRSVKRDEHGYGFVVGRQNGRSRAIAYTLMATSWGDTMVYGAEYTPTALARSLAQVLDSKGLLPASFTEGRRNRDVVALRVVDGAGNVVFNSAPGLSSPISSQSEADE